MINYVGYNWFYNEASVSNTSQRRLSTESVTALMRLLRRLHTEGAPLVSTNEFNYFLLRTISFYLLFAGRYSTKMNICERTKSFLAGLMRTVIKKQAGGTTLLGQRVSE